jgi:putative sigma-54 modulation protein
MEDRMKIDIETSNFPLTEALHSYAERRLRSGVTRGSERIRNVAMRLSDINGPRGGADKRCRLQVVLAGLPDVVVADTQADLYVAIDRATDRAGRALVRKIQRRQTLLRQARAIDSD